LWALSSRRTSDRRSAGIMLERGPGS
jgi:hypothetical protein